MRLRLNVVIARSASDEAIQVSCAALDCFGCDASQMTANAVDDCMALIGRLFVILFAFLAACLVAGMIVVGAVLFPEFSDLGTGPIDQGALNIVLGFGFIFISGFALLPAMIVARDHRGLLYPERAGLRDRRRAGRARLLSRPGAVRSPRRCASRASCGVISKS